MYYFEIKVLVLTLLFLAACEVVVPVMVNVIEIVVVVLFVEIVVVVIHVIVVVAVIITTGLFVNF